MSKSVKRVEAAFEKAGLDIEIKHMPDTTRTAEDAANSVGCQVGQIVKSLIFVGKQSGELKLLLVSGDHQVDVKKVKAIIGENLGRVDAKLVREKTGFAIGGVSPLGHLSPLPCFMDRHLLDFETVWASAGTEHNVFEVEPQQLADITGATLLDVN